MMAFCPEHPKWDQNPKFTPLSETTSIPTPFICGLPPGTVLYHIRSGRLFLCAYCMFHSITGITSSLHFGIMIFQSKRTFCPRQAVCFTLNELPIINVDCTFPWIRTDLTKLQYMLTTNFAIETVFKDEFYQNEFHPIISSNYYSLWGSNNDSK